MRQAHNRLGRAGMPLFWRVCLTNGLVFVIGTAILAASPATVSSPVVVTEAAVLAVGLSVILVTNALLLRSTLAPLDRLSREMEQVDLLRPGQRLPEDGNGASSGLVSTFNAMLDRLEAERSLSSARALAAQEGERRRVAQELHDEVGQSLTAVVLSLTAVEERAPREMRPDVAAARETARESLDEVRRVARRLRPGLLDDLGLLASLSALASDHARLTGADVDRAFDPALPDLPDEVELVVFRIAQEALTNVARHAGATRVELSLHRYGGRLRLVVSDDGTGLADSSEGAGVRGMRERALLVDGRLDLTGDRRAGTTLILDVPIAPETPGARSSSDSVRG